MGNVINLKQVRKRNAKDQATKQADLNRARFGRTKGEREQEQRRTDHASHMLEQHRVAPKDTP